MPWYSEVQHYVHEKKPMVELYSDSSEIYHTLPNGLHSYADGNMYSEFTYTAHFSLLNVSRISLLTTWAMFASLKDHFSNRDYLNHRVKGRDQDHPTDKLGFHFSSVQ